MKNEIVQVFGDDKLEHEIGLDFPNIHLVDLTERTKGVQNIQIYTEKPDNIDTLVIENPNLNISATFFKPQCFINERRKEPDNCEGVFYVTNYTEKNWVLFIEIKDCKSKNISKYFDKAKEQIISAVKIFREKSIISPNKKVYANISFPRRNKKDFYSQLIQGGEKKGFLDKHKIFIRATNQLKIKNETTIH
ncbi:MAG: hypothetical protein LBN18_03730 [Dysgonamonadaceae bacterium]|jgi:hypothetical protein|nr:hypothetical protein [Dysgonamonadaceae bacterium]